jgi:hypothetical protein
MLYGQAVNQLNVYKEFYFIFLGEKVWRYDLHIKTI